jgi:hypothetical protein
MNEIETIKIMQEKWDYLIVLDACRYDYFEKTWEKFLPAGNLSCKKSTGSSTQEWRNKSFLDNYDDVVYVSANPYINSKHSVMNFDGQEHFSEIFDVWATDWDDKAGTVSPKNVTKVALKATKEFPQKRLIIHFLQPHAPYLGFASDCAGFLPSKVQDESVMRETINAQKNAPIREALFKLFLPVFKRYVKGKSDWFLAQVLQLPPLSPMDAVRRKYKKAGLIRAYQENLDFVLQEVNTLLNYLKGKIVITSDHGELLGENGDYSHSPGSSNPILLNIPWFVLEKQSAEPINPTQPDSVNSPITSSQIEERLKALGYL